MQINDGNSLPPLMRHNSRYIAATWRSQPHLEVYIYLKDKEETYTEILYTFW